MLNLSHCHAFTHIAGLVSLSISQCKAFSKSRDLVLKIVACMKLKGGGRKGVISSQLSCIADPPGCCSNQDGRPCCQHGALHQHQKS